MAVEVWSEDPSPVWKSTSRHWLRKIPRETVRNRVKKQKKERSIFFSDLLAGFCWVLKKWCNTLSEDLIQIRTNKLGVHKIPKKCGSGRGRDTGVTCHSEFRSKLLPMLFSLQDFEKNTQSCWRRWSQSLRRWWRMLVPMVNQLVLGDKKFPRGLLASAFIQLNHPSPSLPQKQRSRDLETFFGSHRLLAAKVCLSCSQLHSTGEKNKVSTEKIVWWMETTGGVVKRVFLSWLVFVDFPLLIWRFPVLQPWSQSFFSLIFCSRGMWDMSWGNFRTSRVTIEKFYETRSISWKMSWFFASSHWMHFLAWLGKFYALRILFGITKKKRVVQQILRVQKMRNWDFWSILRCFLEKVIVHSTIDSNP